MDSKVKGLMGDSFENLRTLIDVNTIIGEPVKVDSEITIIPVSKVTYGFASGGSDFPSKTNAELFGGGGGAGITIAPIAFLIINKGEVTIKHILSNDNAAERAVSMMPEMFDKVSDMVGKFKKGDSTTTE